MRFIIVTGMSGAGKSTALKTLEDIGYFCVDNLPVPMLVNFAQLVDQPTSTTRYVAVGIDIRSGQALEDLSAALLSLRQSDYSYDILYLDSATEVLVKRFKETRRSHPLDSYGRIEQGIEEERKRVSFLRQQADYIIDTSNLLTRELREQILKIFLNNTEFCNLMVEVVSFGYKYGIPSDADLVFDVRFLPNPYYDTALRPLTGNDEPIQNFVLCCPETTLFLEKITGLLDFLIPNYIKEGKNSLVIAFGCTGGKHRSVTLANKLFEHLNQQETIGVRITHRDILKDV